MSSVHLALHPIFPVLMLWLDGCPTGLPVGCAGSATEARKIVPQKPSSRYAISCLLFAST